MAIKGLLAQPRRSSSATASTASKALVHAAEDSRCFSILAESQSLHLELPRGGNGRSRREWMDAIAGLDAFRVGSAASSVRGETQQPGVQKERRTTMTPGP